MTPERYPNIEKHSLLIVESKDFGAMIYANCFVRANMRNIQFSEECPRNLLDFMNEKDLELAIIHPNWVHDDEAIIEAHKAGKKIVVIEGLWCANEQGEMYERLKNAGIICVEKDYNKLYSDESLATYDKLFSQFK
jgi:hypothetical protein